MIGLADHTKKVMMARIYDNIDGKPVE